MLRSFECKSGKTIDVVARTAVKYGRFGILLLNDETGSTISIIKKAKGSDPEEITNEIFSRWIEGEGRDDEPRSWSTLVKYLRQVELNTVADEIEEMFIE